MNPRLLQTFLGILGSALVSGFVANAVPEKYASGLFALNGLLACIVVYFAFHGSGAPDVGAFAEALRTAAKGKRPRLPAGSPEEMGELLEQVEDLAKRAKDGDVAAREVAELSVRLDGPGFWVAVLAAVLIVPAALRYRERFVLLATAIQLFFYIGSYFATPHDIRWHVATSWSRLTDQVAVPITYAAIIMLADFVFARKNAPHAEARSGQP